MRYGKYDLNDVLDKVSTWYDSPQGQSQAVKAWDEARMASKKIQKDSTISPDVLRMIVN